MRVSFTIGIALIALVFLSQSANGQTRIWDGGGLTNNWSEAANWSDDTAPVNGNGVLFDSTSTKNCIIDIAALFPNSVINVNAGYNGTISVAAGVNVQFGFNTTIAGGTLNLADGFFDIGGTSGLFTLNGGTINAGSGPLTIRLFFQNGGTFNGSTGTMTTEFSLTLNNGTFNAPSGTWNVSGITVAGGSFNPNGGTINFFGNDGSTVGIPVLNNVTINKGNDFSTQSFTDTRVAGTLTLTEGMLGASNLRAEGPVNIAPTFGNQGPNGDAGGGTLVIQNGSSPRTITLPANVRLPNFRLNDSTVDVNTSGTGTIQTDDLILEAAGNVDFGANNLIVGYNPGILASPYTQNAGTVTFSSGNFTMNTGSSFTLNGGSFTMGTGSANMFAVGQVQLNNGTFNAPSGPTTINTNQTHQFVQTGGVFNGNGTVDFNGTFQMSGGTFNAPTGDMFIGFCFVHSSGGTFNSSGGTVIFDGFNSGCQTLISTNGNREVFNNLIFNTIDPAGQMNLGGLTILQVNGALQILNGQINGNGAGFEAHGNVTIGANADGGTSIMKFSGPANQTFTNNGGLNTTGTWTVDKSGGIVTLSSNLILQAVQTLNLTAGELNQGGSASLIAGTINVGGAGIWKNYGVGGLTLGNSVNNSGLIDFDAGGAPCSGADVISIRSTLDGVQRSWTGTGSFVIQDVDVKDQGGTTSITAFSSTDSLNNDVNWTFEGGELQLVWDGGGVTNNWSEGANWSRNLPPASCNVASFNSTSVKNATIETNVEILGIRINPGYTGTISQGAATILTINSLGLTQSSGSFATGAGSNLVVNGDLTINGGNFNGNGAGSIADVNGNLSLSGGTFASPNGELFLSGNLSRTAGTINTTAGGITFDGPGNIVVNVPANHPFNRFSISKTGGAEVTAPSANTFIINGLLNLEDGTLTAVTLNSRNDLIVGANFDGGNSTLQLNGGTSFDNVYQVTAGAKMPGNVTMNNSFAVLTGIGAGTVTWQLLTLDGGQIQQSQATFHFVGTYTQNNGNTVYDGSGGGDLIFDQNFVKTNGTFQANNPNMSVKGNFTILAGGFNHFGGTIRFDGVNGSFINLQNPIAFNNVVFSSSDAITTSINNSVTVNGSLTFAEGLVSANPNSLNVKGDVVFGADFDGGFVSLDFSGTTQAVTNHDAIIPVGTWSVNSAAMVSLASDLDFSAIDTLNINNGEFSVASGVELTTGNLNIAPNGRFVGGPNLSLNLAANVVNNGRIYLSGGNSCPAADTISLRSTQAGVQRNWSGAGRYSFVNVDARDMSASTEIKIFSGTDSGNNTNWTIESGCLIRVVNTNNFGGGSLRAAITQANNTPGRDTIGFDIGGTAPFTINVSGDLPQITDPVIIDGTTQPDFTTSPVVQLVGCNCFPSNGFDLVSSNNVIKGVAINRFSNGIRINSLSSGNIIQGNLIGTDLSGNSAQQNNYGIFLNAASNNLVGGTGQFERNVVSGNIVGIYSGGGSNNVIKGNFIGTNAAGTSPLPNQRGIQLAGSFSTVVGGISANEGNIIAFNTHRGVEVGFTAGNSIRGNSIHSNAELGIDLLQIGVTQNDPADGDSGANSLQNFPTLTFAVSDGNQTTIKGTLNSRPSSNYSIDFYSNPACDANNFGEGRNYLGSADITTDSSNLGGFNVSLPVGTTLGHNVTATATDSGGNTSEFSQCRVVSSSVVSISGRLATAANAPISNATVRLTGSLSQTTITNSNGEYSFGNVPSDGKYTVTPTAINHDFSPANRNYSNIPANQTNQHFTGTKTRSSIFGGLIGTVNTGGGNINFPLSDVTVILSGAAGRTFNGNAQYFFHDLNPGTYTLTPIKDGWTFSPPSVDVTLGSTNQSINLNAVAASPLEGRIVFSKLNLGSLQANGTALTNFPTPTGVNYPNISLSSNGQKILYEKMVGGHNEVFSANADGSGQIQLTNSANFESTSPDWSPDGTKIVFSKSSALPQKYPFRQFVMNADGSGQMQLPRGGVWLSNTRLLAEESDGGGNRRLVSFNLDGTGLTPITNFSASGYSNRAVSPDGTKIAFLRFEGSQANYYVIDSNGTNEIVVGTGLNVGDIPKWSPDSSRIAFLQQSQDLTIRRIVSVNAAGGGLRTIYNGSLGKFDWGPDFGFSTPTGSDVPISAGGVSINFDGVSTAGTTTVTPIPPSSAGSAPNGFVLGGMAYEINTTAAYTAPITVCFNVPTNLATTFSAFNQLALLHNEGGVLVDRTVSRNFATRTICGSVSTLSPFALGEQINTNLASISGLVQDSSGNPLSDVAVQLTGEETRTATTDAFGLFTFVNLTVGGNYNVQPKLGAYLFTDYSRDFINLTGENTVVFSGTESYFQISGRVSDGSGNPISNTDVSLEGAISLTITTDAGGNYLFSGLPADSAYTVFPGDGNFSYTPNEYQVSPLFGNLADFDFVQLAPTAATSSISGRIRTQTGAGIRNVVVTISGGNLPEPIETRSASFGQYHFGGLSVGETYVITVNSQRFVFSQPSRLISLFDEVTNADFVSEE